MTNESDDIRRYREGSLTDTERHALEKKALSDPFLADALEGAESISTEELQADLAELSSKIQLPAKPWLSPVRIAAGIVMAIGASLFYFYNTADTEQLALEKESPSRVVDSLTTPGDTTQQLLTMAKPEEKALTQPAAKLDQSGKTDTKPPVEKPAASAGPVATTSAGEAETEKTEIEDALLAEEQEAQQADDKKVAETLSAVEISGAIADKAKDDRRAETTKSAAKESAGTAGAARSLVAGGRTVSGKVTSSADGIPLPGVNVVVSGSTQGTVTDESGRYKITLPAENAKLVFSFIGLQTSEVEPGARDIVDVKLGEDVATLSEVVVTGYGSKSTIDSDEPVVKTATPVGGLRAYNNYLERNLRYPREALESRVKGKVTIKFTVKTSGQLSDFGVVRGLGHSCDEEVIRLVKEGPGWSPSVRDDVPIESEVRVRLKFDPEKADK